MPLTLGKIEAPRRSVLGKILSIRLLPGQIVALAGLILILLGSGFLMLPYSTSGSVHLNFIDALFTATSAVCVTGLIVMDTPNDFTLFGQIVILVLVQVGGMGYALMATFILVVMGRQLRLKDRMMLAEAFSTIDMAGTVRFVKVVVGLTLLFETLGAFFLTLKFLGRMPLDQALYHGIFHSISAFNNAGFALYSNSLISFQSDLGVNVVVTVLIILGSVGFLVFQDLLENLKGKRFRLQSHSKLVLGVTGIILLVGTLGIAVLEWNNSATFGPLPLGERLGVSFFHAVSRTAGFSTIDIGQMQDATLYFLILLMAIGGSPGSMSGGIKTTTFAIICLTVWTVLRRRTDVEVFRRRIPHDLVLRAFCLALLGLAMITFFTLLLSFIEERSFLAILFEVTSALGIVGLSLGDGEVHSLSAIFTDFGKLMIILSMLLGRFGPLMIGLFAIKSSSHSLYRYPESRVVIG